MSSDKTAPKVSVRVLAALAFVAVVVYVLDQVTKLLVTRDLVEGQTVDVLGRFLQFHFVKNSGAAFSLASGSTWVFSIAAAAVAIAIVVFSRRIRSLAWAILFGMLLGGTLGNLTDRLFRPPSFGMGHVVDFLYMPWWLPAIFNVADVFIVSSMGLLLLLTLLGVGLDGTRASKKGAPEGEADSEIEAGDDHGAQVAPPRDPRATTDDSTGTR